MKSSDVYPSKYLKAEDFGDDEPVCTITEVVMEELESKERGKEQKPVVYFKGLEKGLVLNKTNWGLIARQHGDESDEWVGKQITLFVMDVEAFGEIVSAIRVKSTKKTVPNVPAKKTETAIQADGELITKYWTLVKNNGLNRKQGLEILQRNSGQFETAITELESGDVPF